MKALHSPRGRFLAACLLALLTVVAIGFISDERLRESTTFQAAPVSLATHSLSPGQSMKRPFVKAAHVPAGLVPSRVAVEPLPAGMVAEKPRAQQETDALGTLARGLVMAGATLKDRTVEALAGKGE